MFEGKEYVYEVYKEKSFSKAAKNLYISQPSLSATIKRIEKKIGFPIFDRSITPIGLTEYGQRYIHAIESIMSTEHDFERYISELKELKIGTLSIGGSNLFTSYVLPPLLSEFTKKYPLIQINIVEDNTSNLESHLLSGNLDFIVDNIALDETLFQQYVYQEEHLLIAVPKEYPINEKLLDYQLSLEQILSKDYLAESVPIIPLKNFKDYPFIFLKPNNDTMKRGVKLCKLHGFTPRVLFELDQQSTAYNIACSGMGICFVSDTLVSKSSYSHNVVYYKLNVDVSKRNISFYSKRNKYITYAMGEFLKIIS
ncbi:MAG: LysR family transcriptional regulator [Anaerocolumna aminovalerica]|jgi:DNA-binding transcriptional LysR family regulator|uniref:LysR family transcriptional regulator n=1 Tax=Anaerocolumna aminovalerica TaxID=1527 RepID=UPI001C0EF295|nr:LysR family transcriptional regulator [Anaerocolumna aminovalerica]MBU5331779.1 LysR family transcriptional regulator [Anaerocolumna aminovalerica]MDU6264013.1 LysR family transcriptional regulator [Anaerocolumna aminovalerica]